MTDQQFVRALRAEITILQRLVKNMPVEQVIIEIRHYNGKKYLISLS